eukprot:2272808-Amphidinium_carterae.1
MTQCDKFCCHGAPKAINASTSQHSPSKSPLPKDPSYATLNSLELVAYPPPWMHWSYVFRLCGTPANEKHHGCSTKRHTCRESP